MIYILVKEYPGSPPIGTAVYNSDGVGLWPEYWKKQTTKESTLEDKVYETIFDSIDIRGIDLRDYKSNFERSDLFKNLCELLRYENIKDEDYK
jgi:hypothetical protein